MDFFIFQLYVEGKWCKSFGDEMLHRVEEENRYPQKSVLCKLTITNEPQVFYACKSFSYMRGD